MVNGVWLIKVSHQSPKIPGITSNLCVHSSAGLTATRSRAVRKQACVCECECQLFLSVVLLQLFQCDWNNLSEHGAALDSPRAYFYFDC